MGWGSGFNLEGREVGYLIDATCDLDGCDTEIDRGLAYVCGGMHDGGEHGCGRYFCAQHLGYGNNAPQPVQLCDACANEIDEEDDDDG